MPDPTPEQPPSWPPASEPTAKPTDPPRIRARGVGHLPSAAPEEEALGQHAEPQQPPADYADLDPNGPPQQSGNGFFSDQGSGQYFPEQDGGEFLPGQGGGEFLPEQGGNQFFPEQPAPEVPQQQDWGADVGGQWPPPENQDWISQQSRTGGWGNQGGAAWADAAQAQPAAAEAPSDLSFRPDPNAVPYQGDPYQSPGQQSEAFGPDAGQAVPQQTGAFQATPPRLDHFQPPPQADPYDAELYPTGPPQADDYQANPYQAAQAPTDAYGAEAPPAEPAPAPAAEPAPTSKKVAAPPTHQGARYVIYGIGGLITLGLIIGIVVMLGGAPTGDPNDGGDREVDNPGGDEPVEDGALSAERYAELASAAGTTEWFQWRYGEAGENAASEEIPQADGGAVADAPLLGEADRSVQGQVGYVTDNGDLSGIDHVTTVESNDDQLGIDPRAGGRFSEDGSPELELVEGSTADCLDDLGGDLGAPVALARPEQSAEINAHSVIAFSSGVIATAGISGAQGGTCLQLPDGLVPTDVALTDGNEIALVTTWNPEDRTGSLVVVALSDQAGSYQSSWSEPYPGLPNPGHFGSAEIVGRVELPLTAPTSVDAWSDSSGSLSLGRTTVDDNPHPETIATSAYALVGSLSESQAVTVDLTSVLTGLAAQHLDGAEFEFDAPVSEPASFEGGIADVASGGEVLAVATGDGFVHELDADLAEQSSVEVGPNPACLEFGAQSGRFIVTSRGESAVRWVAEGEVVDELTDSRLTGAMCARETPALDKQHYAGNATELLVADFEGQALHSYLIGSATLPGGAEIGGDGFSYGGSYEVDGNPFDASVTLDLD